MSIDPRVAAVGLLVERESANAIKALKEADVPAILLKGPLQQRWLEPAGPPRASVDVDLLVLREQVEAAETALRAGGFSRAVALPDEAGGEHSTLWMAARRVPVELHWSLVGADASRVWPVLSRETEVVVLMGERVEIPNEPARCAIVALHAAQHGIGDAAIFGDLEKALVVAGIESWRRASELATALEGWPPFAGALSLSPRGRDLLDELGSSPPVLGERQALNLLTPAPTSLGFYFLARQPGVGRKRRSCSGSSRRRASSCVCATRWRVAEPSGFPSPTLTDRYGSCAGRCPAFAPGTVHGVSRERTTRRPCGRP